MPNPFDDYAIKMVDVSRWQDNLDTPYRPTFERITEAGFLCVSARVGLGRVKDPVFDWWWSSAKGKLQRKPYWFLDYYSHKRLITPISDLAWGQEQGRNWHKYQNGDFGEVPGALDCEPGAGVAITILNRNSYNVIARACAETYDALTGRQCEIYCSPGFIPNLYDWARKRTLWVAWYNRWKTKAEIIAYCRKQGWIGPIKFWQYASDGDINNDGIGDGIELGMESRDLDLNVWLGSDPSMSPVEEWSRYCGTSPIIVPPVNEDPIPPVIVVPPGTSTKIISFKRVISMDGLNVRNTPIGTYGTSVEKWMPLNTEVPLLESMNIGSAIWHRIGYKQWCAEQYNGTVFMQNI